MFLPTLKLLGFEQEVLELLCARMEAGAEDFRTSDAANALMCLGTLKHDPGYKLMTSLGNSAAKFASEMDARQLVQVRIRTSLNPKP